MWRIDYWNKLRKKSASCWSLLSKKRFTNSQTRRHWKWAESPRNPLGGPENRFGCFGEQKNLIPGRNRTAISRSSSHYSTWTIPGSVPVAYIVLISAIKIGSTFQSFVVIICTIRFSIQKFCVLPTV